MSSWPNIIKRQILKKEQYVSLANYHANAKAPSLPKFVIGGISANIAST